MKESLNRLGPSEYRCVCLWGLGLQGHQHCCWGCSELPKLGYKELVFRLFGSISLSRSQIECPVSLPTPHPKWRLVLCVQKQHSPCGFPSDNYKWVTKCLYKLDYTLNLWGATIQNIRALPQMARVGLPCSQTASTGDCIFVSVSIAQWLRAQTWSLTARAEITGWHWACHCLPPTYFRELLND